MSNDFNFFFRKNSIRLICDMDAEIRRLEEFNSCRELLHKNDLLIIDTLTKEVETLKHNLAIAEEECRALGSALDRFTEKQESCFSNNYEVALFKTRNKCLKEIISTLLKEVEELKHANLVLKDQLTQKENTH